MWTVCVFRARTCLAVHPFPNVRILSNMSHFPCFHGSCTTRKGNCLAWTAHSFLLWWQNNWFLRPDFSTVFHSTLISVYGIILWYFKLWLLMIKTQWIALNSYSEISKPMNKCMIHKILIKKEGYVTLLKTPSCNLRMSWFPYSFGL